jgi:hypothetical protein
VVRFYKFMGRERTLLPDSCLVKMDAITEAKAESDGEGS